MSDVLRDRPLGCALAVSARRTLGLRMALVAFAAVLAIALVPVQAQAVVTFGSSLVQGVEGGYACDNSCTYVADTTNAPAAGGATAPQAGVIVRWRVKFSNDPGGP